MSRDINLITSTATIAFLITAVNGSAVAKVAGNVPNTVILSATAACYVKIGVAAVATSADIPLAVGQTLILPIKEGERVSAIRQTADGNLGIVFGIS